MRTRWHRLLCQLNRRYPHAAIGEDKSANLHALQVLDSLFAIYVFGLSNLAAIILSPSTLRELSDFIIYVIDVPGGDKVIRKGARDICSREVSDSL